MSNAKVMIINLIVGLIKRFSVIYCLQFHCIKMGQYFPKPYEPFGGDINVKVYIKVQLLDKNIYQKYFAC